MDILDGMLPAYVIGVADGLFLLVMGMAVFTAPWYKIVDSESSHVFFGVTLLVGIIWLMRSDVVNGINFHLLTTTTLYLMFGWQFAVFAIVLVNIGMYFSGLVPASLIPINVLLLGGVPVAVTSTLLRVSKKHLPHHFFIYIFVNCFFAGAASMLSVAIVTIALYYIFAHAAMFQGLQNFLPFSLLLAVPEAAINGILMSGMIAYRPAWVATFHDSVYINGK
ncbi:MAG TPA: hypothetical protein DD979_15820 [Gammaproteobacteria bacterium]|jgi:uncharacterized membrane protein|nr:hypothetical protein [Gammaproteobacteria bacterium]